MSKIKLNEISVSYGMTVNIGDYENVKVDCGAKIRDCEEYESLEDLDKKLEEMYQYGWSKVRSELAKQVKGIRENASKQK